MFPFAECTVHFWTLVNPFDCNTTRDSILYVFVPVCTECRFRSSKKIKTNFKQTRIHCAQVWHYYLKISEVMLHGLSISRTPL